MMPLEAIRVRVEGRVLFATLDAPPLNLLGAEITRDLISLVKYLETGEKEISVVVFDSACPNFFIAHVDMGRRQAMLEELDKLEAGATLGSLFRRLSGLQQVTIASVAGRVRGGGSEFILACDMRFASRERAIFGQPEAGVGAIPGAGAAQHLVRLMGRGRALEVLLGADDFSADLAEAYGWINRALPDHELTAFVSGLAHRIAGFPLAGLADVKRQVNAFALPSKEALAEDSRLFVEGASRPETQARLKALFERGMQTDGPTEADFGAALAGLP